MTYGRETNCTSVSIDWTQLYDEGGFKYVYRGVFKNGPRSNQSCVAKTFKFKEHPKSISNELRVVNKALDLVTKFNDECNHVPEYIFVNIPSPFKTNDDENLLVEPLIKNFIKFNSNTGWSLEDDSDMDNISQALSHYSYHCTGGNLLLCDIQGGSFNKGFAITDPAIMSHQEGRYGQTDLGRKGIITFFAYHDCNEYCMEHWHRPRQRVALLTRNYGTSMIFRPHAATSRFY